MTRVLRAALVEASLADDLARLEALSVSELRTEYATLFGREARNSNREFLWKKLAWRVQELREGGVDEATRQKAAFLARGVNLRVRKPQSPAESAEPERDPRLPPAGTVITKEHDGVVHEIKVLEDGFEYGGQRFRSLSRVAKEITGTSWNGFIWLGLAKRDRKAGGRRPQAGGDGREAHKR